MDNYTLSKIFISLYKNNTGFNIGRVKTIHIDDFELLESTLENYILKVLGFGVYNQYNNYKAGRIKEFSYFGEISKSFENIIANRNFVGFSSLIKEINDYADTFLEIIDKYYYVSLFIKAAQKSLTNDPYEIVIGYSNLTYTISLLPDKGTDFVLPIVIGNIENFERILENYIDIIRSSNTYYNKPFNLFSEFREDEAIEYIFEWTLKNATALDLNNIEFFFSKYINFITDTTFDAYKNHPQKIGDLFGDELYLLLKKATVAYETPFYFSFMLKNSRIEFPNIRAGIDVKSDKKEAHILAIQSSQDMQSSEREKEITELVKRMLPKSKYFREYNPSHLISLVLALGFFNGYGIKNIIVPDYLPLRYQRFFLEKRKSEEELNNYQYRLTNKFLNTFFRLFENIDGINIKIMPEEGMPLEFELEDQLLFKNEFLQKIYNIGYNKAIEDIKEQESINYFIDKKKI